MPTKILLTSSISLGLLLTLIGCSGQSSPAQTNKKQPNQQITTPIQGSPTTEILAEPAMLPMPISSHAKLVRSKLVNTKQRLMTTADMNHYLPPPNIPAYPVINTDEKNSESYQTLANNPVKLVQQQPVSTFSIDVDTGSYSNIRRMINQGNLPPKAAVRLEELINYFNYQYPVPTTTKQPFLIDTEMYAAPWNSDRKLLKIGLKGYQVATNQLGNANLVFLLDVSGSMNQANKLPLLKKSLMMLTSQLGKNDRVSIVVYAGAAGVVLQPTAGNNHQAINMALSQLRAGGSTHGSQGIELAYQLAKQSFISDGINRVILATDGDFNVGTTNIESLKSLIETQRKSGIGLTTLGFGQGNYNDHLMEQLADIGNGNYAYIDNINEARKVLVDQLSSTLQIIAKDVKIQVEFNPDQVAEYRLLGYENRQLAREDFNNDKVDAGDIGAGHDVTAIYELTLTNATNKQIDPLRYKSITKQPSLSSEIAMIKLRYKQPNSAHSKLITKVVARNLLSTAATNDFKFATAVAAFGQLLQGGKYLGKYTYQDVIELANRYKGIDDFGYRHEFIQLVRTVSLLNPTPTNQ
ncbi:MAG: VWA domain-containing protein [Gammaproteobacteria bacterium]|nr:VWA domain-containing protein [Gammaproteobacteria bacterium]